MKIEIKIKNGFCCKRNPKVIEVKKNGNHDCNKGCKKERDKFELKNDENWTIHVDPDSGNNNASRFWVSYEKAIVSLVEIEPPNVKDGPPIPIGDCEAQYIKSGEPKWHIKISINQKSGIHPLDGSGNVTIGDGNQRPLSC